MSKLEANRFPTSIGKDTMIQLEHKKTGNLVWSGRKYSIVLEGKRTDYRSCMINGSVQPVKCSNLRRAK